MLAKIFKNLTLFLPLLFIISACGSDSDSPTPSNKSTISYKIIGSNDVNIKVITYFSGNSLSTKSGNFGSTWTSEEVTGDNYNLTIAVVADGTTDQSTLKLQIIKDGKVFKESGLNTGKTLTGSLSYL